MHHVLVAVDLSAASESVIGAALRVANATGWPITVLHCASPDPEFVGHEADPESQRARLAEHYRNEHRAVQDLAGQLRDAGAEATALLVQGPTVKTTLAQAEKLGAELIIVGSHGHGAVYDVVLGSDSAGIVRKSPVPVLVVPTREE